MDGHAFILALTTILDGHGGISSIVYTDPVPPSLDGTMTITLADGTETEVTVTNGKGIVSVSKTGTAGLVDTYTITYNDGTNGTFTVTNGAKGDTGQAWYVWIKYAGQEPTSDADMGDTPDNWIGIYSGTSSTAPAHYTSYTWFEYKGDKGDTGDPAEVESAVVEYQTSNSGTTIPTGAWTTTVPTVTQGSFLWTRTTLEFNSGSPIVWYAVAYQAIDGEGSPGTATPLADAGSGSVGTAITYSRQDHQHPLQVPTSGTPQMDGTASQGSATTYSRSDHVHPTDTSKQDTLVSGTNIKTVGGTSLLGSGNIAQPFVRYDAAQSLTTAQQKQARYNINADSGWTLLWENANSTTGFGAQTLSIPTLSNYSELKIVFRGYIGNNAMFVSQIPLSATVNNGFLCVGFSGAYVGFRDGNADLTLETVSFRTFYKIQPYGDNYVADNDTNVPWYIYGR